MVNTGCHVTDCKSDFPSACVHRPAVEVQPCDLPSSLRSSRAIPSADCSRWRPLHFTPRSVPVLPEPIDGAHSCVFLLLPFLSLPLSCRGPAEGSIHPTDPTFAQTSRYACRRLLRIFVKVCCIKLIGKRCTGVFSVGAVGDYEMREDIWVECRHEDEPG